MAFSRLAAAIGVGALSVVSACSGDAPGGPTAVVHDGSVDAEVAQDSSVTDSAVAPDTRETPDGAVTDSAPVDASTDASTDASADASADAPVDGDAGPTWSPTALGTSLVVWLEGDSNVTLSTGKVLSWGDRSPLGNSAVQSAPLLQPLVSPVAVNGHKAIRFPKGTQLTIPDAASLRFGTAGFTVAVVFAYSNVLSDPPSCGPCWATIWGKAEASDPWVGVTLGANSPITGTTRLFGSVRKYDLPPSAVESGADGLNDRVMRYAVLRRTNPTTLDLRLNGAGTSATVTSLDVSAPGRPVTIGRHADLDYQRLDGDIAEIVVTNAVVEGGDLAKLEGYFKAKYGL